LKDFAIWSGLNIFGSINEILKPRNFVQKASNTLLSCEEIHQSSTASTDGRYKSIFHSIALSSSKISPKILSFGCSDGFEPNDLASKYFHYSTVVGCDLDIESLQIATTHNPFPSRIEFIKSSFEVLTQRAPFDLVLAISVLCRWPESKEIDNISSIYSFKKFSECIDQLVSLLSSDGILCVYNSNYSVLETDAMRYLEIISIPDLLPTTQQVKIFNSSGKVSKNQVVQSILFRKIKG
jgi:hypothetical protein